MTLKVLNPINYKYDAKSDVLYASVDKPRPAKSVDEEDGIVIRYDIHTQEIVGFTIIDYMYRKNRGVLKPIPHFTDINLPEYHS